MLFDSSKSEDLNPTLGSLIGGLGFFTVGFVFVLGFFLLLFYLFTYFKTVLSKVTD